MNLKLLRVLTSCFEERPSIWAFWWFSHGYTRLCILGKNITEVKCLHHTWGENAISLASHWGRGLDLAHLPDVSIACYSWDLLQTCCILIFEGTKHWVGEESGFISCSQNDWYKLFQNFHKEDLLLLPYWFTYLALYLYKDLYTD